MLRGNLTVKAVKLSSDVKTERALLNVLFPTVRAELLRILFSKPANARYVRELSRLSGLSLHTVQDELKKLTAAGVAVSCSNGYQRFYRPNDDHRLFPHLLALVQTAERMSPVKRTELQRRPGVARRKGQRRSRPPQLRPERAMNWNLLK